MTTPLFPGYTPGDAQRELNNHSATLLHEELHDLATRAGAEVVLDWAVQLRVHEPVLDWAGALHAASVFYYG